jgi:hypothetical protein
MPQRSWIVPAATLALLTMANEVMATPLGSNLLLNGGAEAGTGSASGNDVELIPDWSTTSVFTVVQYGAPAFPDPSVSTAISGGTNFFAGGPSTAFSSASQTININDLATSVDAGTLSITLSADLGGFDGQSDNMTVTANFLSAASAVLGSLVIGPVTEANRAGVTTLLLRTAGEVIPDGARSIQVVLDATRVQGSYDDGYADNISLVVNGSVTPPPDLIPEPTSIAVLLTAAATMVGVKRRRTSR